jgi:hypothetical protein
LLEPSQFSGDFVFEISVNRIALKGLHHFRCGVICRPPTDANVGQVGSRVPCPS